VRCRGNKAYVRFLVCRARPTAAELVGCSYHEAMRFAREAIRQRIDFAGAYRVLAPPLTSQGLRP